MGLCLPPLGQVPTLGWCVAPRDVGSQQVPRGPLLLSRDPTPAPCQPQLCRDLLPRAALLSALHLPPEFSVCIPAPFSFPSGILHTHSHCTDLWLSVRPSRGSLTLGYDIRSKSVGAPRMSLPPDPCPRAPRLLRSSPESSGSWSRERCGSPGPRRNPRVGTASLPSAAPSFVSPDLWEREA